MRHFLSQMFKFHLKLHYRQRRDTCSVKLPTLHKDFYNGKFQEADQSDCKKFIGCIRLWKRQFCWPYVYLRYKQDISAGYIWEVSNRLHTNDIRLCPGCLTIVCSEFNILQYVTITNAILHLSLFKFPGKKITFPNFYKQHTIMRGPIKRLYNIITIS